MSQAVRSVLVLGLAAAGLCGAATTGFWEMSAFSDFLKGKFENVALGRDGRLTMAPELKTVFSTEQPVIWSLSVGPDGSVYAGTGHAGRVFRIEPDGTGSLLWTSDKPEVFAVAAGTRGVVYAATSPDGKIYRIENGRAVEYFDPHVKYIWALAVGSDGAVYAGTGDGGKIFRITGAGQGEEYYATGQANVTGLIRDAQGRLLAGTEPNGVLYRVTAKGQATVLYDSALPEIRAAAVGADGSVYANALGGALAKKVQAAAAPAAGSDVISTTTTSITVTAQAGAPDVRPLALPKPAAAAVDTTVAATGADAGSGSDKSAIYRIRPDGAVETLWNSKEENVYDVLPGADGSVWFGTDANGRIYRLGLDHKLTLEAQVPDAQVLRLISRGADVWAATGNMGRVYSLGQGSAKGAYESPVFDAGGISAWGKMRAGSNGMVLRSRSGGVGRPDAAWSGWVAVGADGQTASPAARFLQFRAEFSGAGAYLENITSAYLPRNVGPAVRSISILATSAAATATATGRAVATAVTDTGDAPVNAASGTLTQTVSRAAVQQMLISWMADDPDGDKLVYQLDFKGDGEAVWKTLRKDLRDTNYTLDADVLADGRYYFRVIASDLSAEAELISPPVLIDNTPPVVRIQSASRTELVFEAEDAASALRRAEWSLDGGSWLPCVPVDGILDSLKEQFRVRVSVPAGEHLVVVRVADSGGNTGLAKVVLP